MAPSDLFRGGPGRTCCPVWRLIKWRSREDQELNRNSFRICQNNSQIAAVFPCKTRSNETRRPEGRLAKASYPERLNGSAFFVVAADATAEDARHIVVLVFLFFEEGVVIVVTQIDIIVIDIRQIVTA